MQQYRCYFLDDEKYVLKATAAEFSDDMSARYWAGKLIASEQPCTQIELWCPEGLIERYSARQAPTTVVSPTISTPDATKDESALVAGMVAAAADAAPESVALRAGSASMTYRQLMAAADQMAEALVAAGVGANVPVGICLGRSFEQIVGILSVLRAGGAFLPLDPAWPRERIRKVLNDARAPVVIADACDAAALSAADRIVLPVGQSHQARSPALSRRAAGLGAAAAGADDLAYIIYTSGSTGEPKGVEITHANLLNLISWHRDAFGVMAKDCASHLAGLGFDAAVWEVWPYLTAGACVSLVDETVRTSPEMLRKWLLDQKISIAYVPTPLAETLIAGPWPDDTALRVMLTGGDTLHAWPQAGLPFTVVNNYGPTECAVVATSGIVAADDAKAATPSIGKPIANTQIHILDERLRPVPAGEIGEITIGGASVGRGYRNQPALTADKFVADPFRPETPDARLYRTGDLGRRLPDGQIAFHGRCDNQFKIRGHRVEPDEVSAALNCHSMIAQSAVVGRDDGKNRQLVAYVVPATCTDPNPRELREFLALTLPDYMLPSAFVRLASLPLTQNGKVDRSALPPPGPANTLSEADYRAPESAVEARLAGILAELLAVERVGADDNFFLLGGHSLLGTQLVIRARDAFGIDLSLRDLFEAQTVARLADVIEQRVIESLDAMTDEDVRTSLAT